MIFLAICLYLTPVLYFFGLFFAHDGVIKFFKWLITILFVALIIIIIIMATQKVEKNRELYFRCHLQFEIIKLLKKHHFYSIGGIEYILTYFENKEDRPLAFPHIKIDTLFSVAIALFTVLTPVSIIQKYVHPFSYEIVLIAVLVGYIIIAQRPICILTSQISMLKTQKDIEKIMKISLSYQKFRLQSRQDKKGYKIRISHSRYKLRNRHQQ